MLMLNRNPTALLSNFHPRIDVVEGFLAARQNLSATLRPHWNSPADGFESSRNIHDSNAIIVIDQVLVMTEPNVKIPTPTLWP